jgi:hypothetical protein
MSDDDSFSIFKKLSEWGKNAPQAPMPTGDHANYGLQFMHLHPKSKKKEKVETPKPPPPPPPSKSTLTPPKQTAETGQVSPWQSVGEWFNAISDPLRVESDKQKMGENDAFLLRRIADEGIKV